MTLFIGFYWSLFLFCSNCTTLSQRLHYLPSEAVVAQYGALYRVCPEIALSIPCFLPIKEFDHIRFSSLYGARKHPIQGLVKHHNGIDIASPIQEVIATATGIVIEAAFDKGLGNFICIDHGNSYQTRYAHLSEIYVRVGDRVSIGESIGLVGSTGISTGNHIHYEVWKNGVSLDPMNYLLLFYFVNN